MKVKELNISGNITWSPSSIEPFYLACGSSAQQHDASFSNTSVLQLYDLNLHGTSQDMKLAGSATVPAKFHQLLWKGLPQGVLGQPSGIIVGGCDSGSINIYSPDKLLRKEEPLLTSLQGKHTGAVRAIDFNYQQANLLASGASNCEIFIWDINDATSPMTPGQKPNMQADVTSIGWNRQVEHIMAATYGGRCVVYDLRKSSSIIQISESVSQIKSHSISWHPAIATRLIVSSNDDATPVAQVWDLRYATAPVNTLEGHQRGIAKCQWCTEDPDLFITCGKDNRIFVWDPNTTTKGGEIVGEFPAYNQWSFDLSWCPKDPSLVATATIDSYVSVYSLLGAGSPPSQTSKFSVIADSFPGMEMPSEVPQSPVTAPIQLKKPPKWFARRSGSSFGFGGRLISWDDQSREIKISQVITEPEFISKSDNLEMVLQQTDLQTYCKNKWAEKTSTDDKALWSFLEASFNPTSRSQFSALLGFQGDTVAKNVRPHTLDVDVQQLASKMADLRGGSHASNSTSSLDPAEQFEMIASTNSASKTPEVVEKSDLARPPGKLSLAVGEDADSLLRHALLLGDFESAVEVCFKESNYSLALILAAEAGTDIFEKTKERVLEYQCESGTLVNLILNKRFDDLVMNCKLEEWKPALVAILTYADEQNLVLLAETLGGRLLSSRRKQFLHAALVCFICAGNVDQFALCLRLIHPQANSLPTILQEFVELIVILQRALTSSGRNSIMNGQGAANQLLGQYASLLASQGCLNRAMSYLSSDMQGEVALLKERLQKAVGYTSAPSRMRMTSTSSNHSMRRASTPQSYQQPPMNVPMNPGAPNYFVPQRSNSGQDMPPPVPAPSRFQLPNPTPAPMQNAYGGFQPAPSLPPSGPPPTDINTTTFGVRKSGPSRYVNSTPAPTNMWTPTAYNPTSNFTPPAAAPMDPSSGFQYNQSPPCEQTGAALPPPAAFDPNVPRGWNDPPPLSSARKAKQQKPVLPPSNVNVMQPMAPQSSTQFVPPSSNGFFNSPPTSTPHTARQVEPPVQKRPIPSEHQILKDVFDQLRLKGISTTANPAAKQRLDDLAPKLEVLYDKLRDGQICKNTADGLHQIVSLTKEGKYHQALMTHSSIVSSGNFSEMASFMPAVKMLLSMCMQCQVYL